jgi:predicted negative regulator of RcsB-dependent stress response
MKVTQDDLLAALRDALQKPSDGEGQTVAELRVAMQCAEEKVRQALRVLAAQGRLDVLRVRRPSLDGRLMLVPAYRIKM